jgi:cyclopropane fatty-acyl-phospholipid synthase-like methyltransferase
MDKSKLAVEVFDKRAYQYQDKFMDVSLYQDSLDLFCDSIKKINAAILELACGPGNITQYLLKKRPDFKILATDLAENMLRLAEINNPEVEFKLMDCREIGKLNKKYDAIMAGFALPYLAKEEAETLIKDASKILNANGILFLSTMEDDYSRSGFQTSSSGDRLFIHYHQADYLKQALQDNNLKIIELQRQEFPTGESSSTTDLIMIAAKIARV